MGDVANTNLFEMWTYLFFYMEWFYISITILPIMVPTNLKSDNTDDDHFFLNDVNKVSSSQSAFDLFENSAHFPLQISPNPVLMGIYEKLKETILSDSLSLLGELEVSDDEYDSLLGYTQYFLKSANRQKKYSDPLLALTLVQVGIRKYDERKFWDNFEEELGLNLDSNYHVFIGKVFLNALSNLELYVHRNDTGRNQYVMNILMHGFVADKNSIPFYNFVESYFEKNLSYHIGDDIDEDLESLSEWMNKEVNKNTDSSVTTVSNSYTLWKGTKLALADTALSKRFMLHALKNMDSYIFGDSETPEGHLRLNRLFINWTKDETVHKELIRKRSSSQSIRQSFRGTKPYFYINPEKGDNIELIIPPQKFRASIFEELGKKCNVYRYTVKINSFEISDRLKVLDQHGTYMSDEVSVRLPADIGLLGKKLSITFIATEHGGTKTTPLKDAILISVKNYILLDEQFCSVNQPRDDSENYYLLSDFSESIRSENEGDLYPDNFGHYSLYRIHIGKNDVIYIGDSVLTQAGEMENDFVLDRVEGAFVLNGTEIYFLKSHPVISFSLPEEEIALTRLVISDSFKERSYRLDMGQSGFIVKTNNRNESQHPTSEESKVKYVVSLKNVPHITNYGCYSVQLKNSTGKLTKLIKYLLIPNFCIEFDKQRYVFDEIAKLSLNYDCSEAGALSFNYDDQYVTKTSDKIFRIILNQAPSWKRNHIENRIVSFSLSVGKNTLTMRIPIPVFLWRFSNISGKWRIDKPDVKELIKNRTNLPTIDVIIPGKVSDVSLQFGSVGIIRSQHKSGYYRFDPYRDNFNLINMKEGNFLKCLYRDEGFGKKQIRMFNILTRTWIKNFGLYIDKETGLVQAHIDYMGIYELDMEVYSDNGDHLYTGRLSPEKPTDLPGILESTKCRIDIYEIFVDEDDLFGKPERISLVSYTDVFPISLTDIKKYSMRLIAIDFDGESSDFGPTYIIKDIICVNDNYYGKLLFVKDAGQCSGVLYENYGGSHRKPTDGENEQVRLKDRDVLIDITCEENDSGIVVPKIWLAAKRKKYNQPTKKDDHWKMKSPDAWDWNPICFDREKNELSMKALDDASERYVFPHEDECNYKVQFYKDVEEV